MQYCEGKKVTFNIYKLKVNKDLVLTNSFILQVMKKASVVTTSGDAIAIFREIKSLSPHGRYEIKVFPTYIHLHGKTFDYKIAASSVMR